MILHSSAYKHIRKIRITTLRLITSAFAGQYRSAFKGRGIEFRDLREYQPGDDIRFIDWNVTARTGQPHVKKFIEERELTVMLLLDLSASFRFGTVNCLKTMAAAEICALLALTAERNNDKVGLLLFSDRIEKFIPPKKGMRHVLRIIRDAQYIKPEGNGTDIALALDYLNRVLKRNTIALILSDFYAQDLRGTLAVANRRHDVVAVTITDPAEVDMPDIGICQFHDAESGAELLIDTGPAQAREQYRRQALARLAARNDLFRSLDIDHLQLENGTPYHQALRSFFKMRIRRLRR